MQKLSLFTIIVLALFIVVSVEGAPKPQFYGPMYGGYPFHGPMFYHQTTYYHQPPVYYGGLTGLVGSVLWG
jgi:hypothetical protein